MKGPEKLATIVHGCDGSQSDKAPNMAAKVRTWRLKEPEGGTCKGGRSK